MTTECGFFRLFKIKLKNTSRLEKKQLSYMVVYVLLIAKDTQWKNEI